MDAPIEELCTPLKRPKSQKAEKPVVVSSAFAAKGTRRPWCGVSRAGRPSRDSPGAQEPVVA